MTNDDVTRAADDRLEARGALARALCDAQRSIGGLAKDATLKAGKREFDYLSAEKLIESVRGALIDHGLALLVQGRLQVTREVDERSGAERAYGVASVTGYLLHVGGGRMPVGCERAFSGKVDGAGHLTMAHKQLLLQLLLVPMVDEQTERANAGREEADRDQARAARPPVPLPTVTPPPARTAAPAPAPTPAPTPATSLPPRRDAAAATKRVNATLMRWASRRKDLGLTREQAIAVARAALPLDDCWDGDRLLVEQVVASGLDGEFDRGVGTYVVNRRNGATHQVALAAVGSPF